ncbi:MAG: class I mannose-6-phosphate isomerase [Bacilli bacterium]|nr:class I mannose-6-phosphate isomerase [Bacilli bacterium]
MDVVKLAPATKDYIWGGTKLKKWGKLASSDIIAECWELSCNGDGPCLIASGENKGKTLAEIATKEDLGSKCNRFKFFPVLIKLIDADGNLSVQVHPSDEYALKNENQFGKTEMWYVIDAEPGCGLYIGFNKKTSAEEVEKRLTDGTIMEILNFQAVKPGQVYFIPSGTVHAIGKGVTILEIQQNSTLTYRLYDYGRVGKDGKPRELHISKALKVLDYDVYNPPKFEAPVIGECDYFSVTKNEVNGEKTIYAPSDSFASFTFTNVCGGTVNGMEYKQGDTFFVPAGKKATVKGSGTYIMTIIK